jgi:hypothetical protein
MKEENKQLALLVNGKSTKELVNIEVHTQIHQSIDAYLSEDRFNYLVTTDNLKEVKLNNTELNASIKVIKDFGKKLVDLESEDINTFKSNIKEYCEKIDAKRKVRIEEIDVFENETKMLLSDLLINYILHQYDILNIRDEFKKVNVSDLVIISNITAKGALTKSVKDTLNMRLQICKSSQDKYDMRLLQLENICYKNGLETPLTLNHIQGIIYEDNDIIYLDKLTKLIDDEIERVVSIKAQLQKKADDEAELKVKQQIKEINDIFLQPWGMLELETLQSKIKEINDYNLEPFKLCFDHAKASKVRAITFINQAIWSKEKALEDSKRVIDSMITPFEEVVNNTTDTISEKFDISQHELLKDIPENIRVCAFDDTENDKTINITKVSADSMSFAYYDGEQIPLIEPFVPYEKTNEDEKIIVAKFKISGTSGLSNDEVLTAIKEILFNAGVDDESLVSLEVL